jgi:hypothetical protein
MSADPTSKTAQDLITGALRTIGQYAPGETLSADDANDAIDALNGLLDVLSNESLAVYNNNENIITLTPGKLSYTVGSGGDINIQRPLRITQAYTRLTGTNGSIDFPCELVETNQYTSIGYKNQPGPWPKMAYYNASFPLATLYFWPVPSGSYEFHFWTDMLLQSVNLTTQLTLPQGYYLYLQFALAEIMATKYGMEPPPTVKQMASRFLKAIKANNQEPDRMAFIDGALVASNVHDAGFILTGGF